MSGTRFAHVNLIASDWKMLAEFYIKTFGCKPEPPERDLKGGWLDRLTARNGAHIQGIHLRMPGRGKDGPTLEVFQYAGIRSRQSPSVDNPGFTHIAFAVADVGKALAEVERNGGSRVGERVSAVIRGVGEIDVVYARDPEGNIIELQKWE